MRLLHAARKRPLHVLCRQSVTQSLSSHSRYLNEKSNLHHHNARSPQHSFQRNLSSQRSSIPEKETFEEYDTNDFLADGNMTSMSPNPWKNLLTNPARAAWRVTNPQLPSNISEAFGQVLEKGGRTPRQLKRSHRSVLETHKTLAEFRERERRKMVNGKHYRSSNSTDEKSNIPVYYGHDETLATLKHRMMPTYAVTRRVLNECQSLLGKENWQPQRVLDFGIGCGSSSVAALDLFDSIDWIHGIEPSKAMRDCSQAIVEGVTKDRSIPTRVTFSTTLPNDESSATTGGSFDLALCCYTAMELPDVMSTLAAAALMFEKLKPGGVFVMIEPGTPDGFNSIRSVRNMLLDCCPPDDDEFEWEERCHIIAPCTHNGSCPMERHKKDFVKKGKLAHDLPQDLENSESVKSSMPMDEPDEEDDFDTLIDGSSTFETEAFDSSFCSFVQMIPGSRNGEKFSYLVAQKRLFNDENADMYGPFQSDNLSELLMFAQRAAVEKDETAAIQAFDRAQELEDRYLDSDADDLGLELLRGDNQRYQMGRIIRAPIKKKGHIYIDYCADPGRIIRHRVTKAVSNNVAPGMFSAARKSRWGGLWPNTNPKQADT
ncbi:unnamed protein product [Cylindrotheca closterium]|uniref:Methyltransferase domain-containing protein n=1 Tax=Cylindrotheca closterium TaxID=2856 RepID=A0AAD2FW69_9STRA|nr:unnamed protein product [Cylindrotheca closterium]